MKPLLSLLILLPTLLFGQLELTQNTDSGFDSNGQLKYKFTVTNHGLDTVLFYWALETTPTEPEAWEISMVYDVVTCYSTVQNPPCDISFSNYLLPGQSFGFMQISIDILEAFEDACIVFRLLDDCVEKATDTLAEINFKFDSDRLNNTADHAENSDLAIFPNPSSGLIYLKNDQSISKIFIYDIQGVLINTLDHKQNLSHDLSTLKEGSYVLTFHNGQGKLLASKKLVIYKE